MISPEAKNAFIKWGKRGLYAVGGIGLLSLSVIGGGGVSAQSSETRKQDYLNTAGVNMEPVPGANTILVTLRDSSSIAASREKLIDGMLRRVVSETACQPVLTAHLDPHPNGPVPGDRELYVISLNCPPRG